MLKILTCILVCACTAQQTLDLATAEQAQLVPGGSIAITLGAGNNNDVQWQFNDNMSKAVVYATPNAGGSTLTGLNVTANGGTQDPGVSSNTTVWLHNVSASVDIVIAHASTSSATGNRINTPDGNAYTLVHGTTVQLFWDFTNVGHWVMLCQPVPSLGGYATESYVDTATADYATESYVDTAIAAIDYSDLATTAEVATAIAAISYAGFVVTPSAGSSVSLALNTARRPSTTRPTRVSVYANVALASAILALQTATLEMRADTGSTPTTVVAGPLTASSGVGNVGTQVVPITLTYDLPANHYYTIVQSAGAGVVTISHVNETPQ